MFKLICRVTPATLHSICAMIEVDPQLLDDFEYVVIQIHGPTKVTVEMVTEDQAFALAQEPDVQIASM